jgi:uncharacterized protein (DUF924 family)
MTTNASNAAASPESVLQFWFGNNTDPIGIAQSKAPLWWGKSPASDAEIRERFTGLRERAVQGELEEWEEAPRGRLALIVLVDQFSRNMFRDRPESFTYDYLAQEWCLTGLDVGVDEELTPIERVFFYLPLEHSESRVDQARSVALFTALHDQAPPVQQPLFAEYLRFAHQHQDIIERFGRFPHRNSILGRPSLDSELQFLQQPGSSF